MITERNMNKKLDDKWLDDLRERMEDYTEPLPEGLWNQLEGELSQPKIIPFWRRWPSVAAAVALVLVVSSLALSEWFTPVMESPDMQEANRAVGRVDILEDEATDAENVVVREVDDWEQVSAKAEKKTPFEKTSLGGKTAAKVAALLYDVRDVRAMAVDEDVEDELVAVVNLDTDEQVGNADGTETESGDTTNVAAEEYPMLRTSERTRVMPVGSYYASPKKHRSQRGMELGLLTGGMPYSSSKAFTGMSRFASRTTYASSDQVVMGSMDDKMAAYSKVLFSNRDKITQTDVKHRMPINVVASVKWHFTDDWALETGLSYTFLQSELHAGSNLYWEDTQKLHYVGIPIKLHRNLWGNDRFSFYASAGGMIEKCVSGKLESLYVTSQSTEEKETSSINAHPFQWSVAAAVGAQVNVLNAVSLFVEPGMAYYFDDNSHLETIRKEHPFNFNLQFGLRFDLQ